jgi:hypothetical protein
MDSDISSSGLQALLGINKVALNDLAKRGIVERGDKRGFYKLEASMSGYCAIFGSWRPARAVRPRSAGSK